MGITRSVEHPDVIGGLPAFKYQSNSPAEALRKFEKLVVDTQSCRVPAMRWLVAMHEGLFPFVRDICRSRFLLVHVGGTQQGKTTGAQRFTQLLGLGEVKGDYSVAALANQSDIGLLVMDNKEQANFSQPLIDFCLFLATGAQRGRSTTEGKQRPQATTRPVAVITSIEGAWKPELLARCVEIEYAINGTEVDRDNLEDEIIRQRDTMLSAFVSVLQRWLQIKGTKKLWDKPPRPQFERHFMTLAELLFAYSEVAEKPVGWAEHIIAEWDRQLTQTTENVAEDELEYPIREVLNSQTTDDSVHAERVIFNDQSGMLYVTETEQLLSLLRRHCEREVVLPKNSAIE